MASMVRGIRPFHVMIFVLLEIVVADGLFQNGCKTRQQTLYAAKNLALKKSAYTTKPLRSHVACGRECTLDNQCKSVNFYQCHKLCELNNATRAERPEDFNEIQESIYFDADEGTPFSSLPDVSLDVVRSCKTVLDAGNNSSGVYKIYPDEHRCNGFLVYCDMDTDGGGWTVFQRRQDGSEDFYRDWADYKSGFGEVSGEFWLGNDNLVRLTSDDSRGAWELRVDLQDWSNKTAWAKYKNFKIGQDKYTLHIGQYDITTPVGGNSLSNNNGRPFTTKDNDNDENSGVNCAQERKGGWWFDNCGDSNLNGQYYPTSQVGSDQGVQWYLWKFAEYSLKTCSMKIRETDL